VWYKPHKLAPSKNSATALAIRRPRSMIQVKIGPIQKELKDVDQNWVHEMIDLLRKSNEPECIIVTIEEPSINITFSKGCNRGGSSDTIRFNEQERKIIELWEKHMGKDELVPGQLVAFLSQLRRLV
jgi:hypothetical protein